MCTQHERRAGDAAELGSTRFALSGKSLQGSTESGAVHETLRAEDSYALATVPEGPRFLLASNSATQKKKYEQFHLFLWAVTIKKGEKRQLRRPPLETTRHTSTPLNIGVESIALCLLCSSQTGPDYGQGMNPISRLAQIQQAKKEKEPEYLLLSERGMPRRREFIMQVNLTGFVSYSL